MLRNHIQIAFRHLGGQKLNTTLHIVGLTLGMTVCLLITLFIRYELSFDSYHENADRIYRVVSKWTEPGGAINYHFSTPFPLANAIRKEVSGVELVSFAHPPYVQVVEVAPEKKFLQEHILAVEPDFPKLFKVETIKGDVQKTLSNPYQAALTETTAKKLFGDEEPIGKSFRFKIREEFDFTVTSLIKDFPSNTHLPASILVSHSYGERFLQPNLNGWTYVSGTETLMLLPENADLKNIEAQLTAISDKYVNPKYPKDTRNDFVLQPLKDIHLNGSFAGGSRWVPAVSASWLWFFAMIGIAVLVLACINFMNLSTAQAFKRAKEVGIRKSVGARKTSLVYQFLLEAWILTTVSGVFAVALTEFSLPYLNTILNKSVAFSLLQSPWLLLSLIASTIIVGVLSGVYPAWVIAKFNATTTLKVGAMTASSHSARWLRKGLVVAQFSISACMLMVVILMSQQVDFLRSKNLGFNKDNVLIADIKNSQSQAAIFANELSKIPGVKDFTFETSPPSSQGHWGTLMSRQNLDDPNRKSVTLIFSDDHYGSLYNLKLLSGRMLVAADTNSISKSLAEEKRIMNAVVNEKLVRELEFESNDAAVGQKIHIGMGDGNVEIVGVIADFDSGPLREATTPILITSHLDECEQIGIKIQAGNHVPETIAAIESAWKIAYPDGVFSFQFLDEQINAYYKSEQQSYLLFKIFSGMAMFISCLGLFGLAAYTAQTRTKEIGIRKVLGASVNGIVLLLSRDFLRLVFIALLIATPFAWYGIHQWLQGYAYHVEISWISFAAAGLVSIAITLLTVSSQAIQSATANPVESLKSE